MRYFLYILLTLVLVSCNDDFPRTYDNIDGEFPLLLSTSFTPADFSAGDTVLFKSYWGGKKVSVTDIDWRVSWKIAITNFGGHVAIDTVPLDPYIVEPFHFVSEKDSTQLFEMKIKIPDSLYYESPAIPDNWNNMLQEYGIDIDPTQFGLPTTKDSLLLLFDSLSNISDEVKLQVPQQYGTMLDGLAQLIGVPFKLYCNYEKAGGFSGSLTYPVRYNSKLFPIPGVYVNHNPQFSTATIYEVSGNPTLFYPENGNIVDSFPVRNDSVTITYNAHNSFFFVQNIDTREETITTEQAFTDQIKSYEEFRSYWYYNPASYTSIGMIQQRDDEDQSKGISRMIFKLNFGGYIPSNEPLLFRYECSDIKFGTASRPSGRNFRTLWISVK